MTNTPSKAEIEALAQQHLKAFVQFSLGEVWFEGEVEFARAVLARWGTPQPVVREPFTKAQQERLYQNRPANVGRGISLADWRRMVEFIEAAHGITQKGGKDAE